MLELRKYKINKDSWKEEVVWCKLFNLQIFVVSRAQIKSAL